MMPQDTPFLGALIIVGLAAVAFVVLHSTPEWKPRKRRPQAAAIKFRFAEMFDDEGLAESKPILPRENVRICNMSWIDSTVPLGDTEFSHCQFIRCKLVDDGGPFSMAECFMEGCTIQSANVAESQPVTDN